ncbi:MAG TPA: VOC family protein [Pyrinomonadaceae bacterium]|nr:VOC family protein [Pyrinomonadaceae bacterium]
MDNLSLIEKLDQAVSVLLASSTAPATSADTELDSLLRIAVELRDLPRDEFRTQLRNELEGKTNMATTAAAEVEVTGKVNPIREGFRTVTPYIAVRKVHEVIDFVKTVFDAEGQIYGIGSEGGLHSEFRIGESMLMIGGGEGRKAADNPVALHVYVPNTDEVYERALQAGATSLMAPADQEYGERSAAFVDPGGNYWYPATAHGANYIAEGAQNLMPYLHPRGAAKEIDFLKQAFAAEEMFRYASPEGIVYHAKMKVGTSVVEMGDAHGEWQPEMTSMFMLYVDDVDAWYERALQAEGAVKVSEPADQPYGDRVGAVKDPFENIWYIASHIADVM